MTGTDLVVVSGEPLWPSVHGGRLRTAGLVRALHRQLELRVVAPVEGEPAADVAVDPLPTEPAPGRLAAATSPSPRLGRALLGPARARRLADLVARHRPRTVLFAQSYLAAVAPELGTGVAVDFADVEVRRTASLAGSGRPRARLAYGVEWAKARRWEPQVARRALVCAAVSEGDAALLSSWGASALFVPNGADPTAHHWRQSPSHGPVTFVAGFGYRPNLDAARFLVDHVWPRLRSQAPGLRLRLVGRDAPAWRSEPGLEVVGDPADIEPFYREASLVVAPVGRGGGAQLKVTQALARGRLVVASPFSARSAPAGGDVGIEVADGAHRFAAAVLGLWRDATSRWARERRLVARRPVPTWDDACRPLVDVLLRHTRSRAGA